MIAIKPKDQYEIDDLDLYPNPLQFLLFLDLLYLMRQELRSLVWFILNLGLKSRFLEWCSSRIIIPTWQYSYVLSYQDQTDFTQYLLELELSNLFWATWTPVF